MASPIRVGVLADPEAAPAEIGQHLDDVLPSRLHDRVDDREWDLDVCYERLPGGDLGSHAEMFDHGTARAREEGWDLVVCVTDLPLRDGRQPLIADVAAGRGVVVVSLPGFGAARLRRRVTDVVVEIVGDLATRAGSPTSPEGQALGFTDRDLPGPFRLVSPSDQGVDARVVATRGRWRLLVGMVRDNRPWRLLFGLRGAIVAAFAFSAFWMINPSVWQLSHAHGPLRLALISAGTVGAMVAWLIMYHRLWESVDGEHSEGREQALLFNASTVLTLSIGVTIAYVGLLVVNFVGANIVIAPSVLAETIQRSPGIADLAMLTWLATSGASMAGALGTGFESEQSVREAAYSRRERERRSQMHQEQDRSHDAPHDAQEATS